MKISLSNYLVGAKEQTKTFLKARPLEFQFIYGYLRLVLRGVIHSLQRSYWW